MNTDDLITKLIRTGAELDPYSWDDPEEIRDELRDMMRTVGGCKEVINSLLDTIKGLMED